MLIASITVFCGSMVPARTSSIHYILFLEMAETDLLMRAFLKVCE